ncbi:MAG: ABC transporter permease subunit, partial [bacterium]
MGKNNHRLYTLIAIVALAVILAWAQNGLFGLVSPWDLYTVRIMNLCAINIGLGLALNLVNGFTGQFSLGHAGFMAVGAYTVALLTMSPAIKQM